MKHTPGPWKIELCDCAGREAGWGWALREADPHSFSPTILRIDAGLIPMKQDAHLIAAAPDLLEAVQSLLVLTMPTDASAENMIAKAMAAINKAKGE